MSAPSETLHHVVDLPEGAMPTLVVELVEYLDPESGERKHVLRHEGSMSLSAVLGMLDLTKDRLMRQAEF